MPRGVKRGAAVVDGEMDPPGRGGKRDGSCIGASDDGFVLRSITLEEYLNNPEGIEALLKKHAKEARKKAESSKAEAQFLEKEAAEDDAQKTLAAEAAKKCLDAKHDAAEAAAMKRAEADAGQAAYKEAQKAYEEAEKAVQHVRTVLGTVSSRGAPH